MRLYLDANVIIYSIEGTPALRQAVMVHLHQLSLAENDIALTSALSRLECRVKPMQESDAWLLAAYDSLFLLPSIRVVGIDAAIIDRASELRARYRIKTPDALHLATAILSGADVFLTGDTRLTRCTALNVQVI